MIFIRRKAVYEIADEVYNNALFRGRVFNKPGLPARILACFPLLPRPSRNASNDTGPLFSGVRAFWLCPAASIVGPSFHTQILEER
jgi:hypothetical protein